MILGVSHAEGLKIACPRHRKGQSYVSDVERRIKVFRRFGYRIAKRHPKKLIDLKHNAILEIGKRSNPTTHAVVWDAKRKKVLDPGFKGLTRRYYQNRLLKAFEIIG
jgi:hypothetical protein